MQPQPLTIKLLKQISEYSFLNMPSEFEIMRFKRDAEKLKKVDPSDGWMVEAVICSLLGDYEGTRDSFEKALRSGPSELDVVVSNYSISLRRLGKFEESIEVLERYVSDDNSLLLNDTYLTTLNLGYFNKASHYRKKLEAFPDSKHILDGQLDGLKVPCDELNISEPECSALFIVVLSEIRNAKLPLDGVALARNHESNDSLILMFYVDADANALSNISAAIIDKLVELDIASVAEQKVFPLVLKGTREECQ